MHRLMFVVETDDPDVVWMELDLYHVQNLMEGMRAGVIEYERFTATVTDDNGEIIRESE